MLGLLAGRIKMSDQPLTMLCTFTGASAEHVEEPHFLALSCEIQIHGQVSFKKKWKDDFTNSSAAKIDLT